MQFKSFQKFVIHYGLPVLLIIFSLHSCELVDEEDSNAPFQADEYEPNDTRNESANINLSKDIVATIFPEEDVDYYEFQTENTNEWDRVQFDLSSISEDLEIQIVVYDENGEKVFDDQSGTPGANLTSTFETKGGTYYVEVKSRWGGEIGTYTLNIKNLNYNDEYAPNDSRDGAYDLGTLPADNIEGVLVSGDEEDWFKFSTANDGIWDYVQFDVTEVAEDLEITMEVYDAEGEKVFTEDPSNPGANLSHKMATSGGTYWVKIKERWGDDSKSGNYTLNVANLDANDDYEFNDSKNDAHDLGTTPISGIQGTIIYNPGDDDWYMFESASDAAFTVSLTDLDEDLEAVLEIEDASGENNYSTTNSNPGADIVVNTDDISEIIPEAGGIYYVKVKGRWDGDRGDYTLAVDQ